MKYDRPDLRIAPLWATTGNRMYYYQVGENGDVRAVLRASDASTMPPSSWHAVYGDGVWTPVIPYGQEPPLVIEAGQWYRTRDDQRMYCIGANPVNNKLIFVDDRGVLFLYGTNGEYQCSTEQTPHDIVAKWNDK